MFVFLVVDVKHITALCVLCALTIKFFQRNSIYIVVPTVSQYIVVPTVSQYIVSLPLYRDTYRIARFLPIHTPTTHQYTPLHTSTHHYTPVKTCLHLYTPVHTSKDLFTPVHTSTHQYTKVHTSTYQYTPVYIPGHFCQAELSVTV